MENHFLRKKKNEIKYFQLELFKKINTLETLHKIFIIVNVIQKQNETKIAHQ